MTGYVVTIWPNCHKTFCLTYMISLKSTKNKKKRKYFVDEALFSKAPKYLVGSSKKESASILNTNCLKYKDNIKLFINNVWIRHFNQKSIHL